MCVRVPLVCVCLCVCVWAGSGGDRVDQPEVLHQGDDCRVLRPKGHVPGSDQQVSPPRPLTLCHGSHLRAFCFSSVCQEVSGAR